MTLRAVVRDLMFTHPEFLWKPLAYEHREGLCLAVQGRLKRKVSPEAVCREQRRVWKGC